jgi:uncharacterized membrane protein
MQGLGDLSGGAFASKANDISLDGSVAVGFGTSTSGQEAFRWDASNGMQGLGDLAGGVFASEALAISEDGSTIVGWGTSSSGTEAFVWDAVNGMRGLGDLPGGEISSTAFATTPDGSIVIGSSRSGIGNEAFIWDATNGMQELDQYLIAKGLDLTGWTLLGATGVSADGLAFVGWGTGPAGGVQGWYAVIPEPSTGLLFGLGLMGLAAWRRRLT